jgi:hypothetical protein
MNQPYNYMHAASNWYGTSMGGDLGGEVGPGKRARGSPLVIRSDGHPVGTAYIRTLSPVGIH